jgi:1-acyl-sn-glycerol-3-phosphate acyltransferase
MGKHTLFRPPFGWLFRRLGGIPVQRGEAHHLVSQISAEFKARMAASASPLFTS